MSELMVYLSSSADGRLRGKVIPADEAGGPAGARLTHGPELIAAALWVATYLAEGGLQYVGGKIMGAILGDPSLNDIAQKIHDAVTELEAFIPRALQQAFQDHDILELTTTAKGLTTDLKNYAGYDGRKAQIEHRYLLLNADTSTSQAMALAEHYRTNAMVVYSQIASLRLLAACADYRLEPDQGTVKSIHETIKDATSNVNQWIAEFEKSWSPASRVTPVQWRTRRTYPRNDFDTPHDYNTSYCSKDDVEVDLTYGIDELPDPTSQYKAVLAQAQAECDQNVDAIVPALKRVLDAWAKTGVLLK